VFFLDCAGHVAEARLGETLQGLRRICADVRFLGSYPRHRPGGGAGDRPAPAPAGQSDADFADAAAWLARLRAGDLT
jgi:prephenate dehydratase